jgi:hypothetical protein
MLKQGERVWVKDGRAVRAVNFLGNGQRCETWLPVGVWTVEGECLLTVGGGSNEMAPAVMLSRPDRGDLAKRETWYVSPAALEGFTPLKPVGVHTLAIVRRPGRPRFRFAIVGFLGDLWMDLRFDTEAEARYYAAERGWGKLEVRAEGEHVPSR